MTDAETAPTDLIERAILAAMEIHRGQTRDDKRTPFVVHPLGTLRNLTLVGVTDPRVLAAAVLHDTVEDGPRWAYAFIKERFGDTVIRLVEEVSHPPTKDPALKATMMSDFTKTASWNAILIKLADRLDNLTDMNGWKPARRLRYARETQEMLVALAQRAGATISAPVADLQGLVDRQILRVLMLSQ